MGNRDTYRSIMNTANQYGTSTNTPSATTICLIKKVYPDAMRVDVFVPMLATTLYSIKIANNIVAGKTYLKTIPKEGSEALLLLSRAHPPLILSLIEVSDNFEIYNQNHDSIAGETKARNDNVTLKLSHGNSIVSRSNATVASQTESKINLFAKDAYISTLSSNIQSNTIKNEQDESSYNRKTIKSFKRKLPIGKIEKFSNEAMINVLDANATETDKLRSLLDDVLIFKNTSPLAHENTLSDIAKLKDKIRNDYLLSEVEYDDTEVIIEEGADDTKYKISLKNNDEEISYLSFLSDGTIKIKCKDLIIDKGVQE